MSSAENVKGIVFRDAKGSILVDFLPANETVNTVFYVLMLQKLQCALCDKCLMKTHYPST
jgi:hypothetical protein